ncbi:MAG: hypothetical protein JW993_19765 [Sedimentisphaerales bacterium]|nr:hypothetical protein [Sedimentisphaerales bacterium]
MARTVTAAAVKKIMTKGLTGWQAGKLVLQDMVDSCLSRNSVLTEADMAAIQQTRMQGADVRDYNMFMALCRGFYRGQMLAQWACKDACLQIGSLDHALQDAEKRRMVELFESFGPRLVTRNQYEEIVAAQREGKLAFEYGLAYVIEERFYALAPPEARAAIEETAVDIESVADFVAAVPKAYKDLCEQAIDEIRRLYGDGKLPAVYDEKDAKEIKALSVRWKKNTLSADETMTVVDRLYVTGQTLYDCVELPEWRLFVDQYQQHWLDDDGRFRHAYAVLDDCPAVWLDKKGRYKGPSRPSEWITRGTELFLGLIDHDDIPGKPIQQVAAELRDRLERAEQNIGVFLAVKAVLDTAADVLEMDVPVDAGVLAGANMGLHACITLYNLRLEELKEEQELRRADETRLDKALMLLPVIDVDRLNPHISSSFGVSW